jgi:hypothetical protein
MLKIKLFRQLLEGIRQRLLGLEGCSVDMVGLK